MISHSSFPTAANICCFTDRMLFVNTSVVNLVDRGPHSAQYYFIVFSSKDLEISRDFHLVCYFTYKCYGLYGKM